MPEDETYFAPAERLELNEIMKQTNKILELSYITDFLNAFPNMVFVLNYERQVVFANKTFTEILSLRNFEASLGQRPGELIKCVHAHSGPNGCGTGRNCRYCGAVLTILDAIKYNKKQRRESRISASMNGKVVTLNLEITAQPLTIGEESFILVIMTDISAIKKKEELERAFIHDLSNSLTALDNRIEYFPMENLTDDQENKMIQIKKELENLKEEIQAQRELIKLEKKNIQTNLSKLDPLKILKSSISTVSSSKIAQNKKIVLEHNDSDELIFTDFHLMRRVLINLLKNALEASKPEEEVQIGYYEKNDQITFWVKNDSMMNKKIQSQIFQRGFSTKGSGRGWGTYIVKVLVEEYLSGEVTFTSSEDEGTIFYVNIPIVPTQK
ncbi:MAG: GHKL domain-containing protein [Candidatus Heimdallarchaeota archaeon]|nr:GHKL domain-containing protein [Candidatus Heimdallarchaeota archaeon]